MPHSSRYHKAEAKFNVTTECPCSSSLLPVLLPTSFIVPHLGLHAAAATGNIGLAKYAISHGQPVNSVIDGVLPLHAACSGGSDMVVRLLIDNGADVNAPRCVSLSSGFLHPRSFYVRMAMFLAARHITCLLLLVCFFYTISPSPGISVSWTLALILRLCP